jgi:hypothetical protein
MTWVPDACTLPSAERPLRVAEFDELFASSPVRVERTGPARARLVLTGGAEERARDLARRESGCCSFLTFAFTPAEGGHVVMEVAVPPGREPVLDALVARAADAGPGTR